MEYGIYNERTRKCIGMINFIMGGGYYEQSRDLRLGQCRPI